jgi:hypothetical protein
VSWRFGTFEKLTPTNKVFTVLILSWPNEINLYEFNGGVLNHMAGNLTVMLYLAYYFAQVSFCWDPQPYIVKMGAV